MPILRIFCIYCCLLSTLNYHPSLHAHAVVTETSIKVDPITANRATQISVDFNSQIEISLSQVFLVSTGDKQTLLSISSGSKPGQLLIDVPALKTGEYALRFKVFAADGHLTEDIIHFFVTD